MSVLLWAQDSVKSSFQVHSNNTVILSTPLVSKAPGQEALVCGRNEGLVLLHSQYQFVLSDDLPDGSLYLCNTRKE